MSKERNRGNKWELLRKHLKKHWRRIGVKDKCLILIMIILLGQCAYNLFEGGAPGPNSASIDIVMRTTAAAIFGYFISANFLSRFHEEDEEEEQTICTCKTVKTELSKEEEQERKKERLEEQTYVKAQVIITTCIGVFALVILIIARDTTDVITGSTASLSQFRDFVSGCVGFLIGVPDNRNKKIRKE